MICQEPTCIAALRGSWNKSKFCSVACKNKTRNRELKRGAVLYKVAVMWRTDPRKSHAAGTSVPPLRVVDLPDVAKPANAFALTTSGQGALSRMVDAYIREDRELRAAALAGANG